MADWSIGYAFWLTPRHDGAALEIRTMSIIPRRTAAFAIVCLLSAGPAAAAAPESSPGKGIITLGEYSWHFSFTEGPTDRCKKGTLGNRNGIVAWGTQVDEDGGALEKPAKLFLNIYPEDWQPRGRQAHEILIEGPLAGDDWTTAGPSVVESNPQAPALAEARVTEWQLNETRTWGRVALYLKRSLDDTHSGGSLVLESGTFDIHCP
jgi:hypothetical protein